MMVFVGAVCFVLGANLGFLTAGLMHAAKSEEHQPKDKKETHRR